MQFTVQLFIQAHHHGFYTVHVLGEPSLVVHTDDLDQAREDLTLVLADRFERMHPRLVGKYAEAGGLTAHTVPVPDALVVDSDDGPEPRPAEATVLVGADRRWWRVHAPRWDLRAWVPRSEDVEAAASALLADHAAHLPEAQRLALRREGDEWIEPLVVEADGARPAQFLGTWRTRDFLPEPGPPKDAEPDGADGDESEDGDAPNKPGKHGKKPKRPATPSLARVGVALHTQAKDGELEQAYGRDADVQALLGQLAYKGACIAVVGDPGVGKTALLNALAQAVYQQTKDGPLKARPVFYADASRLIAGQGFFGDWQQQCLDVVNEAIEADAVLYLGDLLALLDAGKSAHSDQNVSLLLKPYLAGGRLTVVGEASTAAWAKLELRDAGFARLFAPYRVAEPQASDLPGILSQVAAEIGAETGLTVRPEAIAAVDELTTRFRSDGARLGQAVHFLRRLLDDAAFQAEQAEDDRPPAPIGRAAVVARLCAETGMPEFLIQDDVPLDPAAVQAHFRKRLIGQDDAVRRMTDLVALMKAGLADLGRPLGSFLFVGPTGVGKTEMAKALAEFLFGRKDRLTRFDMSEFVRPDSVHRFLGDAGEEGLLIGQIRRQPFCVLLLDEVEKAHPAVFDVLLQVLGEARLTDQAGRTADFRNTVVLMTSNLGVETFKRRPGFGRAPTADAFKQHFLAEAERFFRP
ncbi:MAG: ATP-dependent Clp protease ATP-binding subunit, partial [Myxococcales bacterium]|nr:ATP-dependent Clp protease ATP-binding subunit [Myxococcales bacterium]